MTLKDERCVLFTIQSGTPLIGTRQKGVIKPIKSLDTNCGKVGGLNLSYF